MSGWKEYNLNELYDFSSGLSKSSDQFGFGYEFLAFKDVFNNTFLPKKLSALVNSTTKERESCSIKKGDVFLTRTSETQDELGMSSVALTDYPYATFNGFTKRLRPNSKVIVIPEFAAYYFRSPYFRKSITSMASITTRASLNNDMLSDLKIRLPETEYQKRIGEILKCLDDKIDLLHRQNATLEKMAETLFRQWFVDKENNGTISQLITIQNGYAFKSNDFKAIGTNGVVKIKNISGGIIDIEKTDFIDSSVAEMTQNRFLIKSGDILIAMTGAEIGKLGIIPKTDKSLWLNQRVGLLKEKYSGSKYLAYLQLKSEFGQDYIENTATGSAQPNISGVGIENCEFPKLNEDQIIIFSEQIGELYDKVIFNLGQIRTLAKLRDTLLPKLMSGEVRVKDD